MKEVKKNLSTINKSESISRRLFMRSVGLGSLGLGLNLTGYSQEKNLIPELSRQFMKHSGASVADLKHYYGHDAIVDCYGVIAPWYNQPNGQCDFRIRIAAETLKRYPWTTPKNAVEAYPHYVFTGQWEIYSNGKIKPVAPSEDWHNGDLGQRSISVLNGMVDYYRYSGDPAAIAHLTYFGNYLIDHCLTPADHPWPEFPISVPTRGRAYWNQDPNGMIQLDICAAMGEGLLRAYQITKNQRWFDAARHWGDLFAENCNLDLNAAPWTRYANPESARWTDDPRGNLQTGGVTMVLAFLDELIRLGYSGKDQQIVTARDAGIRYLREQLLPRWELDTTCGFYFWDWINNTQNSGTTADVANYILKHKELFPNWRNDVRNILTIFLNRSSADPDHGGDVYSGAWAYPESSSCCDFSFWYAPLTMGAVMARYGVEADNALMRELGYRQLILQTYDAHENGVTEDNINGGCRVNNKWFNIAHPLPLFAIQRAIGWLPEELGASCENHLVRSTAVIDSIIYGKDNITYTTFDSPSETIDVFRLSYVPDKILADNQMLLQNQDLKSNGFVVKKLSNGDAIIWIRHDGRKRITLHGSDPCTELNNSSLQYDGAWIKEKNNSSFSGSVYLTDTTGASATAIFHGNQVRVTGRSDQFGGQADVFIDGIEQDVFIDFWNPSPREQQILFYKNGLEQGKHTLKIIARGIGNPHSKGKRIYLDTIQFSSKSDIHNFPSGTGPTGPQRMIFGYTKREDYKDSKGHLWRPATEVVSRCQRKEDTVERYWWIKATKGIITDHIEGTSDPELYRYGFHAPDFWVNVTVGPGKYDVRLKFALTHAVDQYIKNGFDIFINEEAVVHNFNIVETAGSLNKAVDLTFDNIVPQHGVIQVRFRGLPWSEDNPTKIGEAFVQALEIDRRDEKGS